MSAPLDLFAGWACFWRKVSFQDEQGTMRIRVIGTSIDAPNLNLQTNIGGCLVVLAYYALE